MAEIVGSELQVDRFISADPGNGVTAAIDSTGAAVNLTAYGVGTGDVTYSAPTGNTTNTRTHRFDRPIVSTAAGTFTSLALSGAITGATTIAASGLITSTASGQIFFRTGASTSNHRMLLENTSGGAVWGIEGSAGGELVVGSTAYDAIYRGKTGISFSGNDGFALHMRLSSTGAVKIAALAGVGTRTVVAAADGTLSAP